jgi:hypothetical protein
MTAVDTMPPDRWGPFYGTGWSVFGIWCEHEGGWIAWGPEVRPWDEKEAWWALLEGMGSCPAGISHQVRQIGDEDERNEDGDYLCWKCDGDGSCSQCDEECRTCDGIGYVSEEKWKAHEEVERKRREKRAAWKKKMAEQITEKP